MNKKKTIIFLGSNYLQLEAIKYARSLHFYTIAFDRKRYSPGASIADEFYNIDCKKVNKIFKILKKKKLNYTAVWANNDILIESRCRLEEILNLAHDKSDLKTCAKFLNKKSFKNTLNKNILIPNTKNKFPKISKPVRGSGSYGIKIIKNKKDINYKTNIILEDYIKGTEYGLNYYNTKKNFFVLPSVKRYFNHEKSFVPLGTSTHYGKNLKYFDNFFQNYLNRNKIYGPVKVDVLLGKKNKKVIELSNRFHGEIDTTHVFKYIDYALSKIFFKYLVYDIKPPTIYKKLYVGYISVFKKKLNKSKIKKILTKHNLKLLEIIDKKDSISSERICSTRNINKYLFYKSPVQISIHNFKKISKQINE